MHQESAILVNDCHEILAQRLSKLHCLVPSDSPYFGSLSVQVFGITSNTTDRSLQRKQRWHRGRIEEVPVLSAINERRNVTATVNGKRRKAQSEDETTDEDSRSARVSRIHNTIATPSEC
jgi:hypothetical protein